MLVYTLRLRLPACVFCVHTCVLWTLTLPTVFCLDRPTEPTLLFCKKGL